MKTPRVFVSMPADQWLTPQENEVKWGVVSKIEKLGYTTEVFFDPRGKTSLSASKAWSAVVCEQVMRRCDGCVILGFPRWRFGQGNNQVALSTEYNHYEGALAYTLRLPLLTLVQEGVKGRGVFDRSFGGYIGTIPSNPSKSWLRTKEFQVPFKYWKDELAARRDIFLGYCSASSPVAKKVKAYLETDLQLRVLDWATDFDPARTILQQIEEASRRCGAGVFLFTKDDLLVKGGSKARAVPRDNVVFEAGFFSAQKGKERVLIALQSGAKMPADLGGDIYASLQDNGRIDSIKPVLRKFAAAL
jgi:Predicted nucleotide-binding protein containing TIR-like domain